MFLKTLARQKGAERNLLIKRFIKDIIYSKEQVQVNLYYSKDFDNIERVGETENFVGQENFLFENKRGQVGYL